MNKPRYKEAGLFCPACEGDLSIAKPEHNYKGRGPLHNDATVCCHCLIYLLYEETIEGLVLRVLERDGFEKLSEQYQAALMQTRGELLASGSGNVDAPPLAVVMAAEIAKLKRRTNVLEARACGCRYCSSGDSYNCSYRRTASPDLEEHLPTRS